jgi:hypothetical protein
MMLTQVFFTGELELQLVLLVQRLVPTLVNFAHTRPSQFAFWISCSYVQYMKNHNFGEDLDSKDSALLGKVTV